MKVQLRLLLLCLIAGIVKAQNPIYVTQTGAGAFTGGDWANAISGTALQPTLATAPANTTVLMAEEVLIVQPLSTVVLAIIRLPNKVVQLLMMATVASGYLTL